MIFGEGPIIKNIAGDLNKLFLQGTRAGQPINNVEGDAAADQGTVQLMADRDPVIRDISTGLGWAGRAVTVSGTGALQLVNSLGRPLKSWSVEMTPKQDLNGYDSPWPAGGGKNKYSCYNRSYTSGGVDIELLGHSIRLQGTSTTSININTNFGVAPQPGAKLMPGARYTWSVKAEGTYGNILFYGGFIGDTVQQTSAFGVGGSQSITVPSGQGDYYDRFWISIPSGETFDCVFYPQTEEGSAATEWAPYSNICPIYGTDKLNMFVEESYDQSATPKAVITLPQTVYTSEVGSEGGESRSDIITLDGTETYSMSYWGNMFVTALSGVAYNECLKCTIAKAITNLSNRIGACFIEYNEAQDITRIGFGFTSDYATPADFSAMVAQLYAAGTPVQIEAKRVNPQSIPITAPDIPTPEGDSTIWVTVEDGIVTNFSATYLQSE